MPSDILRLEGVRKSYRTGGVEAEVLHGIDLTLREGEFVALIGPSGSGKSTLLNLIGLLDRPTAGKLSIEGREIGALPDAELTRLRGHAIGFIFQYHNLIAAFTAVENVMMPMLLSKGRPDAAMREEAIRLLDVVGLSKWREHPVMQLSGGQQQRVAVARALAMKPPLVLADEPTGNLDTKTADGVFQVMLDVNREHGTAFLVVTHNPSLAARCQRVVELVDGQIVRDAAAVERQEPETRKRRESKTGVLG